MENSSTKEETDNDRERSITQEVKFFKKKNCRKLWQESYFLRFYWRKERDACIANDSRFVGLVVRKSENLHIVDLGMWVVSPAGSGNERDNF